jgi:Fe2+ transport system protein FeoA
MEIDTLTSDELARRAFFVHPPQPASRLLIAHPADSVFLGFAQHLSVPVFWDYRRLANPHICICGMSGSGKSYAIKTFITRASLLWDTSALIIDWTGEYAPWVRAAGGAVFELGDGNRGINIMELGGATPAVRLRQIANALCMLGGILDGREKITLELALAETYRKFGFILEKKAPSNRRMPTLKDVLVALRRRKGRDLPLEDAIGRLAAPGMDFLCKKEAIGISDVLSGRLVAVDLSGLPTDELRSLAGLTILQLLKEKMRSGSIDEARLRHFVVADEAWKIAQDERSDLVAIVREGRKYNFSLIVASQNPNDMSKTVLANAGTVLVFRLIETGMKKYLEECLGYSQLLSKKLEGLPVGQAIAYFAFKEGAGGSSAFILARIEGEEPLMMWRIGGDGMEVSMESAEFRRRLFSLGLTAPQVAEVDGLFEKNSYRVVASALVGKLLKFGFAKSAAISFLREIGLHDTQIANAFSENRGNEAGTLVITDG